MRSTIHLKLRCLMSNRPWSSSPCSRLVAFVMSQRQSMVIWVISVFCRMSLNTQLKWFIFILFWSFIPSREDLGVAAFVHLGSSTKMRDLALGILQPRTHSRRQKSEVWHHGNEALVLRIFGSRVLTFAICVPNIRSISELGAMARHVAHSTWTCCTSFAMLQCPGNVGAGAWCLGDVSVWKTRRVKTQTLWKHLKVSQRFENSENPVYKWKSVAGSHRFGSCAKNLPDVPVAAAAVQVATRRGTWEFF